ncbi:bifunctional hydroxymethylpyrimidine kinase/phosphomethylpyrimidine kinase [Ornithinimicrobium sp. Y1847]|uniref:bifunctional hydroxymethylpyrimidine kinase/phosphomethylpyrimidine kinase n=1 Tax=Ornithinimicrobium sp. Y1847 TaxID=3405419 RepID=UPI003B6784FD
MNVTTIPHALTIAGSDPSGGAGIQADLKTFSALGAYGCAVLTGLTAQSTRGVSGVHGVPAGFVREQVETLVEDMRIDAAKIGMLGTAAVAEEVGDLVRRTLDCPVVLDPVMVSTAGSRLLDEDAIDAVRAMLPAADLITPNLPEAAVLLGLEPDEAATDLAAMHDQARRLLDLGAARVLVKGGHVRAEAGDRASRDTASRGTASRGTASRDTENGEVVDVLALPGGEVHELRGPRVRTANTHGTGCTLSSAIAALLPRRDGWLEAVSDARTWLTGALQHADRLSIGSGAGPVHHFYELW